MFGVGIGGEDRHEVEVCGVDPASRGRRMEECLTVVRRLMTGEPVTFSGEFFAIESALIRPAAEVPIIVGGRSDTAIRRAGRLGDGWLGIWNSPARFAAAVELAAEEAERVGRTVPPTRHMMQVWCGLAESRAGPASPGVGDGGVLPVPFERFERYCPYGSPADVAEFLAPYAAAGCTEFNLIPQSPNAEQAIEGVAEISRLLADTLPA